MMRDFAKSLEPDHRQFVLQLCADAEMLEVCKYMIDELGADPDAGSSWDTRDPRTVGTGSADPQMRTYFICIGLFCARFKLLSSTPEHMSATCVVLHAIDVQDDDREVMIKLMKNADQYRREVEQRDGLSSAFVVQILFTSEGLGERCVDDIVRVLKYPGYGFAIVMEAAKRNLMTALVQERMSIQDVQDTFRSLIKCIGHLHAHGKIHAISSR